jgi:hypothetical protein
MPSHGIDFENRNKHYFTARTVLIQQQPRQYYRWLHTFVLHRVGQENIYFAKVQYRANQKKECPNRDLAVEGWLGIKPVHPPSHHKVLNSFLAFDYAKAVPNKLNWACKIEAGRRRGTLVASHGTGRGEDDVSFFSEKKSRQPRKTRVMRRRVHGVRLR